MKAAVTVMFALAITCIPAQAMAIKGVEPVAMTPGALTPAEAVELGLAQDGVRVVVQGEAIGEALSAPRGKRWLNLLGGGVAIGVVVEAEDAAAIERFGEYRQRGATVLVGGTLNSACDEHGGDLDIHASKIEILDQGESVPHALHPLKGALAAAVGIVALVLLAQYRRLKRRTYL
ncbi:MAG: hypothetical protein U1E26_06415 [Coriobacteriia bacterium]|nr:hypothetical protein [Coriobacteriia bacterium]